MVHIEDRRGKNNKFLEFFNKIRKIKNIEIAFAILILAVVLIAYVGFTSITSAKKEKPVTKDTTDYLESELEKTLSMISGAGEVQVMITYDGNIEYVTANTVSENRNSTSSDGHTQTTTSIVSNPVIVTSNGKSEPVIIKEILPEIKGVIVVAEGAKNIGVRLELVRAVMVALEIDSQSIEIFSMST